MRTVWMNQRNESNHSLEMKYPRLLKAKEEEHIDKRPATVPHKRRIHPKNPREFEEEDLDGEAILS